MNLFVVSSYHTPGMKEKLPASKTLYGYIIVRWTIVVAQQSREDIHMNFIDINGICSYEKAVRLVYM